jgi:hypothetical protein
MWQVNDDGNDRRWQTSILTENISVEVAFKCSVVLYTVNAETSICDKISLNMSMAICELGAQGDPCTATSLWSIVHSPPQFRQ